MTDNEKTWARNVKFGNATLKEELQTLTDPHAELFVGSLSDPYMDIEKEYPLRCMRTC